MKKKKLLLVKLTAINLNDYGVNEDMHKIGLELDKNFFLIVFKTTFAIRYLLKLVSPDFLSETNKSEVFMKLNFCLS